MEKSDIKYLPFVAAGVVMFIGEEIVRIAKERIELPPTERKIAQAAIHFYSTGEEK